MRYSKMYSAISKVLKDKENITFAMTDTTSKYIELWVAMFENKAPWIDKDTKSMSLPVSISSEIARLITIELKTSIEGSAKAEFMNDEYSNLIKDIRKHIEFGCAYGGLIFKPYVTDKGLSTQIVQADDFFPISFDSNGKMERVVFIERMQQANTIYTRVEYHKLEFNKVIIQNLLFCSNNEGTLGSEISLESIDKWKGLSPYMEIVNVDKLPIGYFKIPLANNLDAKSPLGVSCFSRAIDLIKDADERYSQIDWEFKAKETAVHVAESLLKIDNFTGKVDLPEGKERLYRPFEYNVGAVDKPLMDTFSPDIRDTSYYNSLNQQLRRVEFACNLAYGTLSDPNNDPKTAEEIKTSKQRSYSFVSDCQMALQDALIDYVEALSLWCSVYNLAPNGNYDVSFVWDDSLVVDTEKERQTDRTDVSIGAMSLVEYRMKWYGETEEQARRMIPEQVDVMS